MPRTPQHLNDLRHDVVSCEVSHPQTRRERYLYLKNGENKKIIMRGGAIKKNDKNEENCCKILHCIYFFIVASNRDWDMECYLG